MDRLLLWEHIFVGIPNLLCMLSEASSTPRTVTAWLALQLRGMGAFWLCWRCFEDNFGSFWGKQLGKKKKAP
jgi:hypothetical protein